MAFKRYAALLAGSALIGSLTFVQPAMAQENTEPAQCVRTVQETIQVAKAAPVSNPFRILGATSATVAGIPAAKMVDGSASFVEFTIPEDTKPGEYTVTFRSYIGTSEKRTLIVGTEDKIVDKEETFDCATITVDNVTVTTGKTATVTANVQDGATELHFTKTHGLEVKHEDGELTVDAGEVKPGKYTVEFTYKAEGTSETQNGSFQVTVVAKVVQTIDDITVTEGGDVSRDLILANGVNELEFTETHGLEVKHEDGKLTVDAGEVKADTYTVKFTYKADGEDKDGTFKVTVKAKTDEDEDKDEDKDEPKENASSKASSNFLGSFKGSSK